MTCEVGHESNWGGQLAIVFGKPELSCIFDGLVVFKLARAQKTQ